MRPEELETYAGLGGTKWLADVVRDFWKTGHSSPDRCFAAEEQGRPVGRVFFHHCANPNELSMFGTYLDWQTDFIESGKTLLGTALAKLRESGATSVVYAIYDIYDPNPARQQELIEAVGFRQYQEKKRFVWEDPGAAVEPPARLEFRPLSIVGEGAFTDAMQRVTEGTLDCEDKASIAELGAHESARRYMEILKDVDFQPTSWLLGYLADGRLCGLVVPQRLDDKEGCINYVGVVPELRGSGYGFDLLVKGTALLQQKGFKTVVAETDSENRPLHAQLERAGYAHNGTMRCFRCDLAQDADSQRRAG
jgi:ribosomal protein S18 acetylase RimI-like enzyme